MYDYLINSLRAKDVIATFNWDPFLWLVAYRNHKQTNLPKLLFLHGCAIIGNCQECKSQGRVLTACPECGHAYVPMKLLYPIAAKNYEENPYIASQWRTLKAAFQKAFILTIFGYSAPESDRAARDIMQGAWGLTEDRDLEQIEFIDLKAEKELIETWEPFIHTHHYEPPVKSYFDSLLGIFPRRTCEAIWAQNMMCEFLDYDNRVPKFHTLHELSEWFEVVRSHENVP